MATTIAPTDATTDAPKDATKDASKDDIQEVWRRYKADRSQKDLRNRLVERYLPLVKYNGERIWARLPEGNHDSVSYCARLLEETGVSTTPGVVYGEFGEGYLRISLGTATDRIREAVGRMTGWVH